MGRKEKYSAQDVIDAIRESNGIQAAAARRLGCTRKTVASYIDKYATIRDAYEEARDTVVDIAEDKLIESVKKGNLSAIMFLLKTVGKGRGYTERQEVTGADGQPQKVIIEYVNDPFETDEPA